VTRSLQAEREALLIQYVAEMNRGLSIIEKELRAGDVNGARETVAFMRLATVLVDGVGR
jgi:hypothetical protein